MMLWQLQTPVLPSSLGAGQLKSCLPARFPSHPRGEQMSAINRRLFLILGPLAVAGGNSSGQCEAILPGTAESDAISVRTPEGVAGPREGRAGRDLSVPDRSSIRSSGGRIVLPVEAWEWVTPLRLYRISQHANVLCDFHGVSDIQTKPIDHNYYTVNP